MLRRTATIALALTVALLAGCSKPAAESTPKQTIGADIEAKTGKPAFKYVDPRDGYKPRTDLCSVPPCGKAAAPDAKSDAAEKQKR